MTSPLVLDRDAITKVINPANARAAVRGVFATAQPDAPLPLHHQACRAAGGWLSRGHLIPTGSPRRRMHERE